MIEGFLTVSKITLDNGKELATQRAVDLGLIKPTSYKPRGWGLAKEELPLGHNTMVDNGRQLLTYLFGGRTPLGSYVCSRFGIGTGTSATAVTFTELENPLPFYDPGTGVLRATKDITGVDYPVPFIARVEFTLATDEAPGVLITEFGLYAVDQDTGVTTMICRKIETGVEHDSSWSPTFLWRVRT